MQKAKIIMPLPSYGFDPTEAAIPWKILSQKRLTFYLQHPRDKRPRQIIIE